MPKMTMTAAVLAAFLLAGCTGFNERIQTFTVKLNPFQQVDSVVFLCRAYETNLVLFRIAIEQRKLTRAQVIAGDAAVQAIRPICTADRRPSNQELVHLVADVDILKGIVRAVRDSFAER